MTYRPSDFGTEQAACLITRVREHLTPTEISDLIGTVDRRGSDECTAHADRV